MSSGIGEASVLDNDPSIVEWLPEARPQLPFQQPPPEAAQSSESDLVQAARYLQERMAQSAVQVRSESAKQHSLSDQVWQTNLSAAAENATRGQEQLWGQVSEYFKSLGSSFLPVAFLEHTLYDETEVTARVTHSELEGSDREIAKVYVVQTSWCVVVQRKSDNPLLAQPADFICLRGHLSPVLRAGGGTSASAIVDVLKSVWVPSQSSSETFKYNCRLAETDSAPALILAEKVFSESRPHVNLLHIRCIAHRVHKSAERVWAYFPELLTGITRACMVLTGPRAMAKLRKAASHFLKAGTIRIHPGKPVLSDAAQQFRQSLWELFAPPVQQPRRRALLRSILDHLLNGDLRNPVMEHFCFGRCCQGADDTLSKFKRYIPKILSILRPGIFCRRDWKDWHSSLRMFGMGLGCHNILRHSFEAAFGQDGTAQWEEMGDRISGLELGEGMGPQLEARQDNNAVLGEEGRAAQLRQERIHNVRVSLEMLRKEDTLPNLTLMMTALAPEVQLMGKILFTTSKSWEVKQLDSMQQSGHRQYRLQLLLAQTDFKHMMEISMQQVFSANLWVNYNETELFRTNLLMTAMRAPAVVFETVLRTTKKFPFKLFALLDNATDELASAIFHTKQCLLDPFTKNFLGKAGSVRGLQTEEVQQVLKAIAALMYGTTFSVERLHAKNARRARHRVHTHKPDMEHLALSHVGLASADFLEPLKANIDSKKAPGRPRTKERKRHRPGKEPRDVKAAGESEPPAKKQRAGAGGAWRFFVHEKLQGQPFNPETIRNLSEQYWQMSQEEWERCKRLGQEGPSNFFHHQR